MGGQCYFRSSAYINELHDKYLPETYFPIVGAVPRYPRYENKRREDPFVRMFIDEERPHELENFGWGLPIPNEEAAYKSLSKYGKDMPSMTNDKVAQMNKAWEWTYRHFAPYMQNSEVRTYQQVKEKLDMKTSCGAPFNFLYKTKQELFENDKEIDQWFEEDWNNMNENWTCLCTNSLKEEIRPIEKIKMNKIRTFTAMAADMTVHGNRLFADMNEKMNDSWLRSSSTVGWSPFQGNWNRMIKKLKKHPNGYALDESEYDSSLRSYMMWGCAWLRWRMLRKEDQTPENLMKLKVIYRNLVSTIVLSPTGVLVMKLTGNPSGSPNTINDNTLILYTLMAYAWMDNCPSEDATLADFEAETAKCLCGDDNTWTVSDYAHKYYNAYTVIDTWKTLGVTTTTDCMEAREADELDYLSAHTVYIGNIAVPIYDHTKILTSLLYSKKERQSPIQALERVNGMYIGGYTNPWCRQILSQYRSWLIESYDKVLAEDLEWRIAKTGIHSDQEMEQLWCGITLKRQGFNYEDSSHPLKTNMSVVIKTKKTKADPKKRGGRKGPKPKGPKVTRKTVVVQQGQRKPRRNRQRNRNNGGKAKMLTMRGGNNKQVGLSRQTCIIEEHELITDITNQSVAGAFTITNTFALNPGNSTTFPWLSLQAKQWERYEFDYLRFEYRREVSEYFSSGQQGKVILAVDVDPTDGAPASKAAIYDFERDLLADGMPSENFQISHVPRQRLHPNGLPKYVRPAGLPGHSSLVDFDCGNLFCAIAGTSADTNKLGELHVYYRVKFSVPVLVTGEAAPTNNSVSFFQSTTSESAVTTNVLQNIKFATATTNGLSITNTNGSFVPPIGNYLVTVSVTITSGNTVDAVEISSATLLKNNVSVIIGTYLPGQVSGGEVGTSGSTCQVAFQVYVTANGTDAFVCQINPQFQVASAICGFITWLAV